MSGLMRTPPGAGRSMLFKFTASTVYSSSAASGRATTTTTQATARPAPAMAAASMGDW